MAFDVGKVTIEYLPRPQGAAYEFIQHLAEDASCVGEGNAFGFYLKDKMIEDAKEFLSLRDKTMFSSLSDQFTIFDAMAEIEKWIDSLPWDNSGYAVLTFNW